MNAPAAWSPAYIPRWHGLPLSDDLVRASMREIDPKTCTRRVLPLRGFDGDTDHDGWPLVISPRSGCLMRAPSRYGGVGDRLWVCETFAYVPATAYAASDVPQTTNPADPAEAAVYRAGWDRAKPGTRWRSPRFMPRWAARLWFEITGMHAERIQEITPAGVRTEGIFVPDEDAISTFALVWDSLNARRGYAWASNPWVWVVEFKRAR
jgi:hypothetical protein